MDGAVARDYLADDFDMQGEEYDPEDADAYSAFADYIRSLPDNDSRMLELTVMLRPFLEDDPGLDGTLYPDGDAMRMMDRQIPGDLFSHKEYLNLFLALLARDYQRWTAHRAEYGDRASWTVASGRPDVDVCLHHVEVIGTTEPAVFADWVDYLARTPRAERLSMCAARTARVNENTAERVTTDNVWQMVESAEGRCVHCGSLCLQRLPYDPVSKKKLPWAHVGRRIGSVTHLIRRADGGSSHLSNLAWSCLWCNTWRCERIVGATDHGGLIPVART